ncbi:MAG TPA: ribonuclease III [Mariprofundaceae bacterium]|nr:ribonuclease III [Mariprofundaceae bacterium]
MRGDTAAQLERRLGYGFRDPALLARALTHRSAAAAHSERLEFLGDAVLGLVIAEQLHQRFPEADEGTLSRMRATLVCRDSLLKVARRWHLSEQAHVGGGERTADGRLRSPSIVANMAEAVIGAVFTDGGWQAARELVLTAWHDLLASVEDGDGRDAKTRLQEWTQAQGWGLPEYVTRDAGTGVAPRFLAECRIQGVLKGKGAGERKKDAEQGAATEALHALNG